MPADSLSVSGKLIPGEPRIDLDFPVVSGNQRTASSATSLNYGQPKDRRGPTTFGGVTPAVFAEKQGDARYAATTPSSATSINYGTGKVTRELATFHGAAPAEERPLFARKREEARYAASASSSANSLNYVVSRVRTEPATFGKAASAAGRPLLAELRGEARNAVSAPMNAKLVRDVVQQGRQGLVALEFAPLDREENCNMLPTNCGVALALERPILAELRGEARYAATAPPSASVHVGNSGPELGRLEPTEPLAFGSALSAKGKKPHYVAPESTECPAKGQPFSAEKQGKAGYVAPQSMSLPTRERERTLRIFHR